MRVTDDTGRSDEARFAITVFTVAATAPENAPPRLTVPPDQSLPVGTALSAQASATDPDTGDRVTFSLINGPAGMTIDPDTGALDWTPQPDQANTADVVIQATDTAGASDFGSFQVTATSLNVGPSANDDVYIARRGETLVIAAPEGVLSNDSDPNGDALSATQLTGPTLGTVDSFGSDGGFSYTPSEPEGIEIGLEQKCQTDGSIFTTSAGTASAADVDNDGDVELAGLDPSGLAQPSSWWIPRTAVPSPTRYPATRVSLRAPPCRHWSIWMTTRNWRWLPRISEARKICPPVRTTASWRSTSTAVRWLPGP